MSYNALSAEAITWAKQQDAAATTNVANENGADGTLVGGATTADLTQELSLAPWLLRCQTGATGQYINFGTVPASLAGANPRTYCLWVRPAAFDTGVNFTFFSAGETGVNNGKNLAVNFEDGGISVGFSGHRTITPKSALAVDTVYHAAVRVVDGAVTTDDVDVVINAVNQTLTAEAGSPQTLNTGTTGIYLMGWPFGVSAGSEFADFMAFDRALSDAEIGQIMAGPEPTYSTGAYFAASGAYSVGTWDAKSNGLMTYEVVAATAAGDVVDSTTGASGVLDLSSVPGQTVYLLVRTSNSGGYDDGDHATRVSSYGLADDGYYELATVTAAALSSDRVGNPGRRLSRSLSGSLSRTP